MNILYFLGGFFGLLVLISVGEWLYKKIRSIIKDRQRVKNLDELEIKLYQANVPLFEKKLLQLNTEAEEFFKYLENKYALPKKIYTPNVYTYIQADRHYHELRSRR